MVALLGDSSALPIRKPDGTQDSGLVFLFLAIVVSAVLSAVQSYTAGKIVAGMHWAWVNIRLPDLHDSEKLFPGKLARLT